MAPQRRNGEVGAPQRRRPAFGRMWGLCTRARQERTRRGGLARPTQGASGQQPEQTDGQDQQQRQAAQERLARAAEKPPAQVRPD